MALRLESGYPIALEELAEGEELFTAAAAPTLIVRFGNVCCNLDWMTGVAEPQAAHDAALPVPVHHLVSQLPAGFGTLELHTQCITSTGR